jgi:hypothetical protein
MKLKYNLRYMGTRRDRYLEKYGRAPISRNQLETMGNLVVINS